MNKLTQSKWFYMLLSFLVATAFWLNARTREDSALERSVYNIPVETVGQRILETQGLMVASLQPENVSITWKGTWNDIGQLDRNSVGISVDLSQITEPGSFDLNYEVDYPSTVTPASVSILDGSADKIHVVVSEIYKKNFAVQPVLKGSVAEGYRAGEFVLEQETITISGVQEKVEQVAHVQVVLEQKKMSESFTGELPVVLLDRKGEKIDRTGLWVSTEWVSVHLPIVVMREIGLDVTFIPGGGATEDHVTYKITPSDGISVSGPEALLEGLESINLGTIDLSQVFGTYSQTFEIDLPARLENVSGLTSATVEVSIDGLDTKTVEVKNIELINVPKGYRAELVTRARTIVLRGTAKELKNLNVDNIRIIADLSELSATGSYNVPVSVHITGESGVGVIGQNNVVVKLTRD